MATPLKKNVNIKHSNTNIMQPGINNDTFSENNEDNPGSGTQRATGQEKENYNGNDRSRKQDQDHENKVNDVSDNDKVNSSWDAESKTYNQKEDSWKEDNDKTAETSNEGTQNNNWDANDQTQRTGAHDFHDDGTREASTDDYIDSDRETYNRNNDRFKWSEPEDEE